MRQGRFGPYVLLETLGLGRSARTYLALRDAEGVAGARPVSLKFLQAFADVKEQREALRREAELQSRCRHEAIVPILEVGLAREGPYIAREYVAGWNLAELSRLAAHERMPEDVLVAWGGMLLQALDSIHGQLDSDGRPLGLIHRDVTPSNILVAFDGHVRLTDFGLAYAPALHGPLGEDEIVQGTRRYLPPEVAAGHSPDARADLFQLALCLAELLLGAPLRNRTPSWDEIANDDLAARVARRGECGPVLARALASRPSSRYGSAKEMLDAWTRSRGDPLPDAKVVARWLQQAFPEQVRVERARLASLLTGRYAPPS